MMSDEEFNKILTGPLSHPLFMFQINRLAIALRSVVEICGEQGERALRTVASAYQDRDECNDES